MRNIGMLGIVGRLALRSRKIYRFNCRLQHGILDSQVLHQLDHGDSLFSFSLESHGCGDIEI